MEFKLFNGLWARNDVESYPPDHFADCSNLIFTDSGFRHRDGYSEYNPINNIVRMHLYKPNPPFTGTNVPRIIALNSSGQLIDVLLGTILHTDVDWVDFALVNFFGRCFISPHDGRVGLENEVLYIYDGTTFRSAGPGVAPTNPPTGVMVAGGNLETGDHLFFYAWETASGAISPPSPYLWLNSNSLPNIALAQLANIAVGPAGTVARWVLGIQTIPYPEPFSGNPLEYPLYFVLRIADNTTTTADISYFSYNLRDSADYLLTLRETIPAGVGLLDFRGRLITYGIFEDPSLVLASEIGEPESHSETSGFFITDPSDSTGVRSATEFRDTLYVFKRQRGYMTQDNGETASTWQVIHFEKSIGTEQYGIAAVMDAKGASSDGYLVASVGGIYYFNGIFQEPELTYKIRDYWSRINENFFHKVQLTIDPINKRLYALVPLDSSQTVSHIIFGDYREGLNPKAIKWCPWELTNDPTSILIYTDFTADAPFITTKISNATQIATLLVDEPDTDSGITVPSFVEFPPVRFGAGVSQFTRLRISAKGPETFQFIAYSKDKASNVIPVPIPITSAAPGREYSRKFNLVNEECRLRMSMAGDDYKVNALIIEGNEIWGERPQ